ncbi:MAG TPA: hypothetical protein VIT38_07625 [Allosphingosinicella sp.]|jgi:hypothetical protein
MKKTLFLLTAVTAFAAAAPATAQNYGRYAAPNQGYSRYETNFDARIQRLRGWLNSRERAGTIDRREATSLRRQINDLNRLEQRYRYGGFTAFESDDLQNRIQILDQNLQVAHAGSMDRYGRYQQGGYYGQQDGYYGQQGIYGQQGGYYGRGGPVEELVGLLIGQRAPTNLGRVPYDYGARYRDREDVYYRSDGRSIYEIDARSGMVMQVYPMR